MPTKSVKKTTAKSSVKATAAKPAVKKAATKKTTAAKKTVIKEAAVKKPAVKKTTVKKAPVQELKQVAPAPEMNDTKCACGSECTCGADCKCKRSGSKFGRFMWKLIVALIIFALGFAAAKLCGPDCGFRGPRVEFANGCLDVTSVKCPRVKMRCRQWTQTKTDALHVQNMMR